MQSFDLESRKADIDLVIRENAFMAELQSRIVPVIVQYETFWTRYFYQWGDLPSRRFGTTAMHAHIQNFLFGHNQWDWQAKHLMLICSPAALGALLILYTVFQGSKKSSQFFFWFVRSCWQGHYSLRRLHKVTEKHKQMQQVVQRARSQAPPEDLSWDDEEDSKKVAGSQTSPHEGQFMRTLLGCTCHVSSCCLKLQLSNLIP